MLPGKLFGRTDVSLKQLGFYVFIILISSIAEHSWSNNMMEADRLFEKSLLDRNIKYKKLEDGRYELATPSGIGTISLDNIKRNYIRDGDPEAIERFVETILQTIDDLPDWNELSLGIYPSLESSSYDGLDGVVYKSLSDTSVIILAHYNEQSNQVRWIRESDLKDRKIDINTAWEKAFDNIDEILTKTNVEYSEVNGQFLGIVEAHEPYKASLVLSKKLKQKVSSKIGWPIYAVAPARDFVFLFSKDGGLINNVGHMVVKEFKNSGHPISPEVWELSDKGAVAIGAFPAE